MNIYFVSQESQLRTSDALIRKSGRQEDILIYMSDPRRKVEDSIYNSGIALDGFYEFKTLELPEYVTTPSIFRLRKLVGRIRKILKSHKPEEINLFCFDNFYNIIISEARKRKIKVNYIEEGLSTYFTPSEENYKLSFARFVKDVKNRTERVNKRISEKNWLVGMLSLPFAYMGLAIDLLSCHDLNLAIMKSTGLYKEYCNLHPHFDTAFMSFPERNINIDADNFVKIDIIESKLSNSYMQQQKALYVSQPYAGVKFYDTFYATVFEMLEAIGKKNNCKIDFKMHPREKRAWLEKIYSAGSYPHVELMPESGHSAEEILLNGGYKAALTVCSSIILYMNAESVKEKGIKLISVGSYLLWKFGPDTPPDMRLHVNNLNKNFDIIQYRPDMKII